MKRRLTAAALTFLLAHSLPAEEPVDVLRAQVEELKSDLDRPLGDLNLRYEEQLLALKEQAQQSGDLDLALATSDELTSYKTQGSKPAADPKLKRLQEIYASETARLGKIRAEKHIELLKGYRGRLDAATTSLTKAGDLESALTYRQEVVSVDAEIAALTALAATQTASAQPAKEPEPEKEEGPKFAPGVYQMGEGFGPTMTFYDNGRYDARFFGSGRWKANSPGKMVLNSSDEFSYVPDRDVWIGTIDLGGKREIVLKFVGSEEPDRERGRGRDDESSEDDRRRPPFDPRNPRQDRR